VEHNIQQYIKDPLYTSDFGQGNRTWLLAGPFPAAEVDAPLDHPFLADEADLTARPGQGGWSEPIYFFDDRIDLGAYFDVGVGARTVAYGFTWFDAPADQQAELWIGSDEGLRVWINGEIVYDYTRRRTYRDDEIVQEKKLPVRLRKGENRLLVKSVQEFSDFQFALNICEPEADFTIDGDQYMRERPIEHLGDALLTLGAQVSYRKKAGCPPILLRGGLVKGGNVSIRGDISSQYLTALLMALPLATDDSNITIQGEQVSKPYLDITLGMLKIFGVTASHENYQTFNIPGNQTYRSPGGFLIEGDASSASYFFGAAAIGHGPVRVHGLGKNSVQGDYQFLDTIELMAKAGIGKLVECGPGKVLGGLVKRIQPGITTFGTDSSQLFNSTVEEMSV